MTEQCLQTPVKDVQKTFSPQLYEQLPSVERVNSRLDVSFGFEEHYIRGMKKMEFRCGLALCVMLTMALGRALQGQMGLIHSLVKTKVA